MNPEDLEIVVTAHGDDPKIVTQATSLTRDGYAPDVWLLCEQMLDRDEDDGIVIQLRNDDGDNWLVNEKGLEIAVLQQDCIYATIEHETDSALLLKKFATPAKNGMRMMETAADIWLPKSQVTAFELKDD